MKKGDLFLVISLIVLIGFFSSVDSAVVKTKAWHNSANISISVKGFAVSFDNGNSPETFNSTLKEIIHKQALYDSTKRQGWYSPDGKILRRYSNCDGASKLICTYGGPTLESESVTGWAEDKGKPSYSEGDLIYGTTCCNPEYSFDENRKCSGTLVESAKPKCRPASDDKTMALINSIAGLNHSSDRIWVLVANGEGNLSAVLNNVGNKFPLGLCRKATTTVYTGPTDVNYKKKPYHYATEVEVVAAGTTKSLQEAINNGDFCHTYEWVWGAIGCNTPGCTDRNLFREGEWGCTAKCNQKDGGGVQGYINRTIKCKEDGVKIVANGNCTNSVTCPRDDSGNCLQSPVTENKSIRCDGPVCHYDVAGSGDISCKNYGSEGCALGSNGIDDDLCSPIGWVVKCCNSNSNGQYCSDGQNCGSGHTCCNDRRDATCNLITSITFRFPPTS